uniref:Uncharacterized protein n=1 Tax=Caenorhabditis tropicalis TaxID=1561998 RepID=A0A1I7T8H0_9PELO
MKREETQRKDIACHCLAPALRLSHLIILLRFLSPLPSFFLVQMADCAMPPWVLSLLFWGSFYLFSKFFES